MRSLLKYALAGLVAAAASTALGQTKSATEATMKSADSKVTTQTVFGTVKEYAPGKKIVLSGPKDKTYSFDLDGNVRVDGVVVEGQGAKVIYVKDNDGRERVTILSAATREAVAAAMAPKMHTESTTKSKSPEGSTTVKTETVVGIVKEFEAGKKIVVTGPQKKDYSFDLDENASVSTLVAVGDRVKVTFTKGDHGYRATVVSPSKPSNS